MHQIQNPVEVGDIPSIEDRLGVGINIYSFIDADVKGRYPLYATNTFERMIDPLYWDQHYAWIKNVRPFMADLSRNHTLHWCRSCLGHFDTEVVLKTQTLVPRG